MRESQLNSVEEFVDGLFGEAGSYENDTARMIIGETILLHRAWLLAHKKKG